MPPSEPPRSSRSRPSRRPRKKPASAPRPSSQNAQAYVSQGRVVAHVAHQQQQMARVARVARRSARDAAAGPQAPLTNRPGITSRQGSPAPRPQSTGQQARSQRAQHVSQGRQVEQAARSQQRHAYTDKPLAERRRILNRATLSLLGTKPLTPVQRTAVEVHAERARRDVSEIAQHGIPLHQLLHLPPSLDLRLNTFAEPVKPVGADRTPSNPEAKALPAPKTPKLAGNTQVLGLTVPGLHQGTWAAGRVLEQLARPLHAVAGGLKAEQEGGDVLSAVGRGLANKDKYTFSDLPSVKSIPNPVARTAAGLGGDVIFDPLNWVTAGLKVPADVLTEGARQAQRLADAAEAAGNTAKAARLAQRSRTLAERAAAAPTNRGIQVGVRGAVGSHGRAYMTSGGATAQMFDLLKVPQAARAVRETAPVQAAGKALVPGFRPAGVDPREWERAIAAERSARATTRTGLRQAEDLGRGFHAAVKNAAKDRGLAEHDVARHIIDAVESGNVNQLHGTLRPVAQEFQRRMGDIASAEQRAGVLKAIRSDYVPHQWEQTVTGRSLSERMSGRQRNVFADKRSIEGTISEINAKAQADGLDPIFSTNLPGLVALRAGKSAKVLGHARFQARIVNDGIARQVTDARRYSVAHPGDFLYELKPGGMTALEDARGNIDWSRADKLIKEGKQVVGMNKIIGDRYTKGFGKVVTTEGPTFGRGYDRFMSGLKTALTVLNVPAYDLRNLTGDSFNAYLADTSTKDVIDAAKAMAVQHARQKASRELGTHESAALVNIGAGHKVPTTEALARAEKSGAIQTGYVGGEKFEVSRGTQAQGIRTQFGGVRQAVRPVDRLRAVGQVREDWIRMATWLGAKRRGMSDEEAAKWTNMHHFDYQDLTDAERGVLRRVFPFYTFTARNTRLQATKLLTNPGKYANYQAFREEMGKQAGLGPDWEHHLEPYQQRGAGVPFRLPGQQGASMAYPALPLTDLSRLGALLSPKDEGDLIMQSISPLIKTPTELVQNYSFFFKGPIWRDAKNPDARHWVPAPPQFAQVPALRNLLGMKRMPDSRNRNKQTWMMTAKADYLLRQLPQTNFAVQALTPAVGSHGQSSKQSIVSQLTGVKLGTYDRNTVELRNAQRRMQDLRVSQNDLKDQGQDRSPGGGHYSKAYRKVLDDINRTQKRIDKLKKRAGYAPPRKPVRGPRKQGSGIYGAGGGGSVYGAPASGGLYGAP
jgi:hypothetical protein